MHSNTGLTPVGGQAFALQQPSLRRVEDELTNPNPGDVLLCCHPRRRRHHKRANKCTQASAHTLGFAITLTFLV